MADNPELGRRLRDAKRAWEQRHDYDLSWRELGERIGSAMGRGAVAYQVVQRWFQLGREPAEFVDTLAAIARVLETDPRELTFGEPEERTAIDAERAARLAEQHEQAARVRQTYERNMDQPQRGARKRASGDGGGTT